MYISLVFRTRRTFVQFGVAIATSGISGCPNGGSATSRTAEMATEFTFDPETITIAPGGTVTWTNTSDVDHTVTAYGDGIPDAATYFASGGFESERSARDHVNEGRIAPDDEYEQAFEQPRTYRYYCIPHEGSGMIRTVRVDDLSDEC